MPSVRYVGPIDEVDVVGVGVLKRGDDVEVTAEQEKALLDQSDNFTTTPAEKKKG